MKTIDQRDLAIEIEHLRTMSERLVWMNLQYLITHPDTIRCEHFVGRLKVADGDEWQDVQYCIESKSASPCDICAWKVAELRLAGDGLAHVHFSHRSDNGIIYVEVIDGEGHAIDPVRAIFGDPPHA